MMARCVVPYDGDCGPCSGFKRILDFLDTHGRIGFVALSEADRDGLLDCIPPSRRWASFHTILPDGGVESGAEALPRLVSLLPLWRLLSNLVLLGPFGTRATGGLYSALSKLHGSCSRGPSNALPAGGLS